MSRSNTKYNLPVYEEQKDNQWIIIRVCQENCVSNSQFILNGCYYSQPIRNHYEKHDVSEVFYSSDLSCSFISSTRIGSPFNARSISSELFTPCLCPVSR